MSATPVSGANRAPGQATIAGAAGVDPEATRLAGEFSRRMAAKEAPPAAAGRSQGLSVEAEILDLMQRSGGRRAVAAAVTAFEARFAGLAGDPGEFHRVLQTAFGDYDRGAAESLRHKALQGDFDWLPEVRLMTASDGRVRGAYAGGSGTVYLEDSAVADPATALRVLSEELGHHLESLVRQGDAAGDEGAIFSRLLLGEELSAGELADLQGEQDHGTIAGAGGSASVEFNVFTDVWDWTVDTVTSVGEAVVDFGSDSADNVVDFFTNTADTVGDWFTFGGEDAPPAGAGEYSAGNDVYILPPMTVTADPPPGPAIDPWEPPAIDPIDDEPELPPPPPEVLGPEIPSEPPPAPPEAAPPSPPPLPPEVQAKVGKVPEFYVPGRQIRQEVAEFLKQGVGTLNAKDNPALTVEIQQALAYLGMPGTNSSYIDGRWDNYTAQVLNAFQASHGISGIEIAWAGQGVIGQETMRALIEAITEHNQALLQETVYRPSVFTGYHVRQIMESGAGRLDVGIPGVVTDLQKALAVVGVPGTGRLGFVDGVWGPETEAAVKTYQASRGLAVDGIVGPETLRTLTREIELNNYLKQRYQASSSTLQHVGDVILRGGELDTSNPVYVTDLQGALKALGVDGAEVPGFADGQWDDATRAVLAKFQQDHALPVTGKADAETLKVLGGAIDTLNQVKNTLLELDADDVDLLLDLTQISLDIAGIVEPTGVADIASGLIGLSRGDWFGAGISFAGALIPYAGDLAKLTKLQSWSNTVERFVSRAARDPAYAEKHQLVIQGLRKGLDSLPEEKLAKLPESVWTGIERLQSQIDTLLEAGLKTIPRDYGKNAVKWVVDEQGRLIKAEAILREVPEVARSAAEVRAQGRIARQFGQEGDNGGHVIANRFIGNQGDINIFPQHRDFNQSAYRVMENELADWVKAGAEVKFEVKFSGFDAKGRPERILIKYKAINPKTGEQVYDNFKNFDNAEGQTFDRLSKKEIAQRMQIR